MRKIFLPNLRTIGSFIFAETHKELTEPTEIKI